MEAKKFVDTYQAALHDAALIFKLSEDELSKLEKDGFDLHQKLQVSKDAEIELGEFVQECNKQIDKSFTVKEDALKIIEAYIQHITDKEAEQLLSDCSEMMSVPGHENAKEQMTKLIELSTELFNDVEKIKNYDWKITSSQVLTSELFRQTFSSMIGGSECRKQIDLVIDMVKQTA